MSQVIPRIVHRIWLGANPIPEELARYGESWARHHPGWEMKLWTDETLPPLKPQREFDRARDFKSRYDIVRLEVLRQLGGIVIDMDMEAIRPLDPLLDGVTAFVARTTSRRVGNQVLGAVPNHPLYEYAIERLKETAGTAPTASQESGPGFLSRVVAERPEGVTILPRDTFFSPLTIEPPKRPEKWPDIYAVHHHLESYRQGEEGRVVRLERRLHEAQLEIARLLDADDRLRGAPPAPGAQETLATIRKSRWWRLGVRLRIVKLRI